MPFLLKKNDLPLDIEIHSDPLCVLPAALSKRRAHKVGPVHQREMPDNKGGAPQCLFCNPDLLDGRPKISYHLDRKVISFPNAAPFLPGDQRVICLWNEDQKIRYAHAHKFVFADFRIEELYYLIMAAVDLSKAFPTTSDSQILQKGINLIRCVAGFNIGELAGQSIPHFHLQYGWEVALTARDISEQLLQLFYQELREQKLILYEDDMGYLIVPWTPKGRYHIEFHFKHRYELCDLNADDVKVISHIANVIMKRYATLGIRSVNILFTGSPHGRIREPLTAQFVPRVNMTALYEMMGVNVVDTLPEQVATFFQSGERWSDILTAANACDPQYLYRDRFESDLPSGV